MITPNEIKNKEFTKGILGYNESEVDQFLDTIIESYEKLFNENNELKDKVLALTEKTEQFGNLEETLKETLLIAQKTATEIVQTSKDKADILVNEAELESKKILEKNSEVSSQMEKNYNQLKKDVMIFKTRYRTFMESQLAILEEFESDIESEINKDNLD